MQAGRLGWRGRNGFTTGWHKKDKTGETQLAGPFLRTSYPVAARSCGANTTRYHVGRFVFTPPGARGLIPARGFPVVPAYFLPSEMRMIWRKASFLTCILAVVVLAAAGCHRAPKPIVHDLDSYQRVRIGAVHYVAPEGVRTVEHGPGYVVHSIDGLPDVRLRVEHSGESPRSLAFDTDTEQRRFARTLPPTRVTSTQYAEHHGRERMKVIARGAHADPDAHYGSLLLIREDGRTALLKVDGPLTLRAEMNNILERMAGKIEFGED